MSTFTVVEVGLVRLVLEASHVNFVRRNDLSMEWNVISFRTVPLLKISYVSSISEPDLYQVNLGSGFPEKDKRQVFIFSKKKKFLVFLFFLQSHDFS